MSRTRASLVLLVLAPSLGCGSDPPRAAAPRTAPSTSAPRAERPALFEGLGPHTRKVTTKSAEAQRYFDQGLAFLSAFNHDEAERAFAYAAELDPSCAMAHWGIAMANGPHINRPEVDAA